MTVKELIDELEEFDRNEGVLLWPDGGGIYPEGQYTEQIAEVIYVQEINRVVIKGKHG